jgi:peptidoglycan/xylan/chitin deacetylase (PgdA/CDA1 family)
MQEKKMLAGFQTGVPKGFRSNSGCQRGSGAFPWTQRDPAGHEVANHYFANGSALGHSNEEFLNNLEKTESAIGLTGTPKLFRPPGGIARPRQLRLAKERAYTCVLGTAYPHDPMHPPVWYMSWLIRKNLVPGTIVVLHDGISDATRGIATLSHVLAEGQRRGLTFVSVGELMSQRADGGLGESVLSA